MGSRINKYGRGRNDHSTVPKINWHLRYRCCQRFGHKGMPCARCKVTDESAMGAIDACTRETVVPAVVNYIFAPSPLFAYLKKQHLLKATGRAPVRYR